LQWVAVAVGVGRQQVVALAVLHLLALMFLLLVVAAEHSMTVAMAERVEQAQQSQ
jgi:hypothetical protein